MTILQIYRECNFPITDDPHIAREQAVCCCEKPKGGIGKIKIGNHEFNAIVDNSIPIGTIIFQNPKTGKEVGRIVNIHESEEPLNDVLAGAYEATKTMERQNGSEQLPTKLSGNRH